MVNWGRSVISQSEREECDLHTAARSACSAACCYNCPGLVDDCGVQQADVVRAALDLVVRAGAALPRALGLGVQVVVVRITFPRPKHNV